MSLSGEGPLRMSRSSREAIPNVRELSGSSPEFPGVVERHTRMSESCGRLSQNSGSGQKTLRDVWEW